MTNSRKRRPGCFVVQAALLFFLVASSKTLLCQPALAPAGWDAVERLKKGSEIVVERGLAAGEQGERVPCRVLRVENAVLVCTPHAAKNGTRLVYAARQVDAVYQCKTHTSLNLVKAVLYAGAGWVAGGIITDDRWDYPLATMGAVGWGLVGLSSGRRELRQTLIYRRVTDEVPSQGHSGALLPATLPHPDCSATASGGFKIAR